MTIQELEQCIREYGGEIYSFCRYLANDQQEADDLYQDTFLKALELQEKIHLENNPKSYLLSVALRIWKNKKRKYAWRKRIANMQSTAEEPVADQAASADPSPEEQAIRRENAAAVRAAVNRLPQRLKVTVLLFYMEEQTAAQIAEILKIPVGTVLSRLYQARQRLKKELENVLDGKETE